MTSDLWDEPHDDPITAWRQTHERVAALVAGLDDEQLATSVPATPDWTVHHLLAHMVGLGADVVAGNEPDDHDEAWTKVQVDARRDRSAVELLEEWAALAPALQDAMRSRGPRPLADVVIHEQDLRGALGEVGGRTGAGLEIVRGWMADRFGEAVATLPPIALVGGSWTWASRGRAVDADVLLEALDFDLFRALTSRRTPDQIRSWVRRGDVAAYLDGFAGLGTLPEQALPE